MKPMQRLQNAILGCLAESKFVKVMQFNITKEMWDKLIQSYESGTKVKIAKIKMFRI